MSYPEPPYQPPQGYDFTPTPPQHPSSTAAFALGLIGLLGAVFCAGITLMVSPFAWAMGAKAVREIDLTPDSYSGREMAMAGKVMGMIGTALLALGVIAFGAFFAWVISL